MADVKHPHIIETIYAIIQERRKTPRRGSYTNYLQRSGIDKMLKKISEEAGEVIVAAKNNQKPHIIMEAADLLYHLLVVLEETGVTPREVIHELERRFRKRRKSSQRTHVGKRLPRR